MLPHHTVVLEVTQACHYACVHCYNFWREERGPVLGPDTLTRAEIRSLLGQIRKETQLQGIGISGGEPLLREDLPEIVCDLAEDGLSAVVISNAGMLTPERVQRFPHGTTFELTLFAPDREIHDAIAGAKGAFERTLSGIGALRSSGCHVLITVVISRRNAHLVRETIELGLALGASGILLNRVNLSRFTFAAGAALVPSSEQMHAALAAADSAAVEFGTSIAVSVPIPPCFIDPAPFPHLHFGWCPRGGKDSYYTISHNGLLRPCNHSSAILGNLRTTRFRDIVRGEKTRAFWRPRPLACRSCTSAFAKVCRGGCPASAVECLGSAAHIDPVVRFTQEADGVACLPSA